MAARLARNVASFSPAQLADYLFGYDFFISYSWSDGADYPRQLMEQLTRNGYAVFLDSRDYVLGIDLRASTRRRVRMSRYLVLVLRPHAVSSKWVERELKVFLATGRDPIAIDVDSTWEKLPPASFFSTTFATRLRFSEALAAGVERPSDTVVADLGRAFQSTRREVIRARFVTAAATVLLVVLIIALWQWYLAEAQRRVSDAMALDAMASQHFSEAAQTTAKWDREWAHQLELEGELAILGDDPVSFSPAKPMAGATIDAAVSDLATPAELLISRKLRAKNLRDEIAEVEVLRARYTIDARSQRTVGKRFLGKADEAWKRAGSLSFNASAARQVPAPPGLFSVEVLSVGFGESIILHYGDVDAPKFIVIDGGQPQTYRRSLGPRLIELRNLWAPGQALSLENVIISNQDIDRLGGILRLLQEVKDARTASVPPTIAIKNIWYESFGPGFERDPKAATRLLIEQLGLRLNKPFPTNVMRPADGAVVLDMGDGLTGTILSPTFKDVTTLFEFWTERAKRYKLALPQPPAEGYDGIPGVVRNAGSEPAIDDGECRDRSVPNRASHVVLYRFSGRTFLHGGDACTAQIEAGLRAAGLVGSDGTAHVDLMLVPHQGSRTSVNIDFFRRVKADSYLFTGNGRFDRSGGFREEEGLGMLLEARKGESYTLQFINRDGEKGHGALLDAFLAKYPASIYGYRRVFRSSSRGSMSIDLLDRVRY
ncbi:toll/interleukin-1 receptor domain-containing protein [Mesorhizobium sp. M0138]|uniref:toll/interleukin-1 receptor domain-containing protein n=1 Tax=Mesorhizobium sp. M0138 TaxID=2956891 RepID=UPI003336CCF2